MSGNSNLEEIKLVVENVKHKKMEGSLYVMSERIAWMPKGKSAFTTSHYYVDIKSREEKYYYKLVEYIYTIYIAFSTKNLH